MLIKIKFLNDRYIYADTEFLENQFNEGRLKDATVFARLFNIIDEWNSYFNHKGDNTKINIEIIEGKNTKIRNISEKNKNFNMNHILQNNKQLQHMIQNMNYNLVDNVGKLLHKVDKVTLLRQAKMRADNEFPLRE